MRRKPQTRVAQPVLPMPPEGLAAAHRLVALMDKHDVHMASTLHRTIIAPQKRRTTFTAGEIRILNQAVRYILPVALYAAGYTMEARRFNEMAFNRGQLRDVQRIFHEEHAHVHDLDDHLPFIEDIRAIVDAVDLGLSMPYELSNCVRTAYKAARNLERRAPLNNALRQDLQEDLTNVRKNLAALGCTV